MWIEEFSFSLLAVICQFIIYCFSRKCGIFRILYLRELEVNKFIFRRKLVVTSTCLISCTVFVICCSGVHCKKKISWRKIVWSLWCVWFPPLQLKVSVSVLLEFIIFPFYSVFCSFIFSIHGVWWCHSVFFANFLLICNSWCVNCLKCRE